MLKGLLAWVWVAYEPSQRRILGFWLSWTRSSFQAELFLESLVELRFMGAGRLRPNVNQRLDAGFL
ncbi:MAG: hypothetical protein QXH35_05485 [Nitrososphaerota archaeon]